MAVDRVFGAIQGAGTQVREKAAPTPIQDAPLGSTAIAGIYRSGPTAQHPSPAGHVAVSLPNGVSQFRRVYGGLTQASEAPLNVEHFYSIAGTAGGNLHLLRVTDGSEVQAGMPVFSRDVDRAPSLIFPASKLPAQVHRYNAQNGGRWGGRRTATFYVVGDMAVAIASDTTLDLGLAADTLLDDQFVGALIVFPSIDPNGAYKITGHDDAGLFTIEGLWSQAILDSVATDVVVTIVLENEHELTGDLEALAIEIADGGAVPSTQFSLYAYRDGTPVTSWQDNTLLQGSERYWLDAVKGDLANYELDFAQARDLFAGDPGEPLNKPANWAGTAQIDGIDAVVLNTVQLQITWWQELGAGDPYLETATYAGTERPCTITCTFTSATDFDISVAFEDGETATGLSGTLGTATSHGTGLFPEFLLRQLSTPPVADDTLTIVSRPLPPDLAGKGALLYPAAAPSEGDVRIAYRVVSNTHDSVTVSPAVDLSAVITPPSAPNSVASTLGPHTLTGGETFIFDADDGAGDVTLTSTLGAGSFTDAQIRDELNSLAIAAYSPAAPLIVFDLAPTGHLRATLAADSGADASFDIDGATSTLTNIVGWPTTDVTIQNGVNGSICRLQYRQEMGGGYDGIANIADSDYEIALDTDPNSAPLSRLLERNTGVISLAVPGVPSVAVQQAAMLWAFTHNGIALVELPDTIVDEAAAVAYHEANLAIGTAQNYSPVPFPSYGKIASPYGPGLYTTSMLGAILGRQARMAVDAGGYHLAAAGIERGAYLSPIFRDLTTGDRRLNNELLNGYGLTEIRQRGAAIVIWGDRIPGDGETPFLHIRKTVSHIGRIFLTNLNGLVFRPINQTTFAAAFRDIRGLMAPWQRLGWFDDANGPAFEDQVSIVVDDSNNPPDERAKGNLHIGVAFLVVATAERVILTLSPNGVSESA